MPLRVGLRPVVWRSVRRVRRSTCQKSASTAPSTTDCPSPQAPLTATAAGSPEMGSAVKATPAASASTSTCTSTAIAGGGSAPAVRAWACSR